MRPFIKINYLANTRLNYTEHFCYFMLRDAGFINFAYFSNVVICEFCSRMIFTAKISSKTCCNRMLSILRLRNPLKIVYAIICFYAIKMINKITMFIFSNKRDCNNSMNKKSIFNAIFIDGCSQITLNIIGLKNPSFFGIIARTCSAYSSKIAYFIKTFISNNCAPLFHNHSPINVARVKKHGSHHGKWCSGASLAMLMNYTMQRNSANILAGGIGGAIGLSTLADLLDKEEYQ